MMVSNIFLYPACPRLFHPDNKSLQMVSPDVVYKFVLYQKVFIFLSEWILHDTSMYNVRVIHNTRILNILLLRIIRNIDFVEMYNSMYIYIYSSGLFNEGRATC